MMPLLTDTELERLSAHVANQMGLHFPRSRWRDLEHAFSTAAIELGYPDVRECIARFTAPLPARELVESMAGYLTIGETYFFREERCFKVLEERIIPEIIRQRRGNERRLRIWSAGCATGEEPYSIAILLYRMRSVLRGWNISILATDINPHALRTARAGIYTQWSFRNTLPGFKEEYFRKTTEGRFELLPALKKMVTFAGINLVKEPYPSLITDTNATDVIFCRNVLMYFTPQLAADVVARFRLCLPEGGWLFVSPCETSNSVFSGFEPVNFPDATLYQKAQARTVAPQHHAATIPDPPPPVDFDIPPPLPPRESHDETSQYRTALTLYEQGAYRDAEAIAASLTQGRNGTGALALLCRIYANEGRLTEALNLSDQALAANKFSAGLHYLRAVILQEQGLNSEAAASLTKALYLDPDQILAHFTLANLAQQNGRIKESRKHFANALSLLDRYRPDEVIPESDGMFAGRLTEIIRATIAGM